MTTPMVTVATMTDMASRASRVIPNSNNRATLSRVTLNRDIPNSNSSSRVIRSNSNASPTLRNNSNSSPRRLRVSR